VVKPEDYTNTLEKFRKILRLDFYEKVLEDQKIKVAIFRLENSSIEIITPTEMGSTVDKFLEKRGGGIHHVAIMVDKVDSEVERLKNEGFVLHWKIWKGLRVRWRLFIPRVRVGF